MAGELGNFAGGYAEARDARKKNIASGQSNPIRDAIFGKKTAGVVPQIASGGADGVGGTVAKPTFVQKLKSGLAKAGKSILGFERGGQVTRTGVALVHKGEHIIPANQTVERKALRKSTRRSGRR